MRRPPSRWHVIFAVLIAFVASLRVASAQDAVPDHRYLISRDVDFFGADLTNLFDATQTACARACSVQSECVAFTFNTRSVACFTKSAITDRAFYEGAVSATKVATAKDVLRTTKARTADLSFLQVQDFNAARAFVKTNANRYSFNEEKVDDLIAASQTAENANDMQGALRWAGKAVAHSDRADLWTRYARLALMRAEKGDNAERSQYRSEALNAAINAYLRALQDNARTQALQLLPKALEQNNRGRDMVPALRLAIGIEARPELQTALDEAIGQYGFRITDHRIENNVGTPRICAEFSEPLVQAGVDYGPFVRTAARGLVVQPDNSQVCIDGVVHGERYDVTFRAGLPGSKGEVLHKDVRLTLYVRDRLPSMRFAGRAYVLPRSPDAALPIKTVNTDTLDGFVAQIALSQDSLSDFSMLTGVYEQLDTYDVQDPQLDRV